MPIVIEGSHRLEGQVTIGGAKNAALPIICATLLTNDDCLLENVPYIEDIRNLVLALRHLGVAARFEGRDKLRVKATRISRAAIATDIARQMRASFLLVGPLLARFGQAEAPHPGGCSIGTRPVSVDLKGYQAMGAEVTVSNDCYVIKAPTLNGQRLVLDYPSHTGTENLITAACLAKGTTIIENASIEPEVVDLCDFLCAMGARVQGAGTSIVRIDGVRQLHGAAYRIMPDRMEAGTFALAGLITGGKVAMDSSVAHWSSSLTGKIREAGGVVEITPETYTVSAPNGLHATDIQTYPYPGFPTDLQAPYCATMTQAEGRSSIQETMFSGRLHYVNELKKMGASIDVSESGRNAMIHGATRLKGSDVCALDIRAGAAMILAGLAAEGTTRISNVLYIDRGYEGITEKLTDLGAVVHREQEADHDCPVADCTDPIEWDTAAAS